MGEDTCIIFSMTVKGTPQIVNKTGVFFTFYDNSFIWFQYRIIQRILGKQEFLHKIKQSDLDICQLCGQCCETITHLFLVCNRVNSLWKNLQVWI